MISHPFPAVLSPGFLKYVLSLLPGNQHVGLSLGWVFPEFHSTCSWSRWVGDCSPTWICVVSRRVRLVLKLHFELGDPLVSQGLL